MKSNDMQTYSVTVQTPAGELFSGKIESIIAPTSEGELTILARHEAFFCPLVEGIMTIKINDEKDEILAIGGGYLRTNKSLTTVLISSLYGQDKLDESNIQNAISEASTRLKLAPTEDERKEALSYLRRSTLELKLLQKTRRRSR